MSRRRRRWRRDPIALSGEVGRYRRASGVGDEVAALARAWAELVGPQAAAQSVVVRRSRAGVVTIACAGSPWAQQLDSLRDGWTDSLAAACPDIPVTGVRFVVADHVLTPPDVLPAPRREVHPTATELAAAADRTPPMDDEALRELLVRAQAGQMAVARERKRLQRAEKLGPSDRPG